MKLYETIDKYLKESSLSRVYQLLDDPQRNFGVISPFREDKENPDRTEKNEDYYKELKDKVRSMGYGFVELRGGYTEGEKFTQEKSLLIPNIKPDDLVELGKQYDQDSVLYKSPDKIEFLYMNGSRETIADLTKEKTNHLLMSKDAVKDFFSALFKGSHAGTKFSFGDQPREGKVTVEVLESWSMNKSYLKRIRNYKRSWLKLID